MPSFADYGKNNPSQWITAFEGTRYPDYLTVARKMYEAPLAEFGVLLNTATDSADLLRRIVREPLPGRIQLMRIFRRYVSQKTPVEMLKKISKVEEVVTNYGADFRSLAEVRLAYASRPHPDEALMAVMYEHADRGSKGYELTARFFKWFEETYGARYQIDGPVRAGKDVMLHERLPHFRSFFSSNIPADIYITRTDGTPLVAGFARYDSDRGGAQEDDRTGQNHDKATTLQNYAARAGIPLKVLFLNDGPGLTLGSMWRDYAALEAEGNGRTLVCTLKMLSERLTSQWLES
ncbi:hypothetical protein [Stigmatella erecta]|uniref:BstEII n=1 Tax=Stigmatella erecta TaxID=83460 RepID=A0A1I0LF80_9BACT|nr:hypothetical protein [Stigmatella erecta]SEU38822.1 hypothetical protein SAMN05443639_1293 [Stigmatella erecta]